jgi:hypothetical protein
MHNVSRGITEQELGEIYNFAVELGEEGRRLLMELAKARRGNNTG